MQDTSAIARQWLAAFNAHDLESLLALYHEVAVHYSPKLRLRPHETEGIIRGKAALAAWWRDALERLPSLQYHLIALTGNESRVFMEYTRHIDGEQDMQVAETLKISNGQIGASHVYHG